MSKQGILISVADDQDGKDPRIVTETEPFPVALLDLDGENVAEQYSKAIKIITTEHAWVHAGKGFVAGELWNEGAAIADNASVEVLIQAGNTMHVIANIVVGGDSEVRYFKGTTFSAAGTSLTAFNKNDNSTITSSSTITHTPTLTADGTQFPPKFIPGGTSGGAGPGGGGGSLAGGSDGSFSSEFILKSGEDYLIRITNRANATITIGVSVEWYEPNAT